ncbi:D-isomer specific 2-hydroxyacid dehydrogenase NAD-binding protein [Thermaerobacter marianensis DSM 12885]|uniref:D-isomer specific 2-hydroxyacid dehydrogenase NAD-binding protein n=1 Tax=Thermaerobacter marianensis (strain ATCC 700841 / DSM 12885 / JCM 10246 / 7p75a) TaxID=644966 RepID=E6SJT2_THEM7|nr:D-isomer specific 2-hydroxyacid dehydrogenase NAD-binding protein [Thermaerobacter marianensis DSM 12885]
MRGVAGLPVPRGGPRRPVAVVTTDDRQVACARELAGRGWPVRCWGRPVEGLPGGEDPAALDGAAVVVGPVTGPPTAERMTAAGARWREPAAWRLAPGALYVGGRPGPAVQAAVAAAGGRCVDILADDAFAEANAWPTAEGAVLRAQQLDGQVVGGRPAVVVGYGRCGRALARLLRGFGCPVTVVARREASRQEAAAAGAAALPVERLGEALAGAELVFNTVPAPVLGDAELAALRPGALVIDIASHPGGVDWEAARRRAVRAHLELGLPARFFPVTAGRILADRVEQIVRGEGGTGQQT